MKYCTDKNALLLKKNSRLLNEKNDNKSFLIIIDKENLDKVDDILKDINKIKKERKIKTGSKKIKTGSKKIKTRSKKFKTGSKRIKTGSKKIK